MNAVARALLASAKIRLLDLTVIGIAIAALAAVLAGRYTAPAEFAFEAERWRADRTGCSFYTTSERKRMSRDLAQKLLAASPPPARAEVERMLGAPDAERSDRTWRYRAGTSTMDCLTFTIQFDDEGRLRAAYLAQH